MLYGFIVHIPTVLYNRPINIVTLLLTFEPKDLANNYVIKEKKPNERSNIALASASRIYS